MHSGQNNQGFQESQQTQAEQAAHLAQCAFWFWQQVYLTLLQYPTTPPNKTLLKIDPQEQPYFAHPSFAGASRCTGLWVGQVSDWRFDPDESGRGLHVQQFPCGSWVAHLDEIHPKLGIIRHLKADAPKVYKIGLSTIGAIASKALGGSAILGGLGGLLLSKLTEKP